MSKKFIVYGKPGCPFCVRAEEELKRRGETVEYIDVTKDVEALKFLRSNGFTTVPQIYLNDHSHHIGGYTGLMQWYREQD